MRTHNLRISSSSQPSTRDSLPAYTFNSSNCRSKVAGSCSRPATSMPQDSVSSEQQAHDAAANGVTVQQQDKEQQQIISTSFTDVGLEELRQQLQQFAAERHWEQFHTPRNLLLALVGEVGELSEIFQWRGEVHPGLPGFSAADRAHVGQELSDVLLYLIRLADVSGVDLGQAVRDKLAANAAKYPAEHCRGKADKYTAYADAKRQYDQQQQQQQEQQQEEQQQPEKQQ